MGRSGFLIILLICFATAVRAQLSLDFKQADSITYANTISGNWNEVIRVGKQALDKDIDYFYLRLRMGISYFNKNNFRSASNQFGKAALFNPGHGLTRDYQYRSLLYGGQSEEAAFVADHMNQTMREVSGVKKPGVFSSLFLETGAEFSNNFEINEFKKLPPGQALRYQDLYGNSFYAHIGLNLHVHPRVNLYIGYSNLNISKKTSLQYAWNEPDSIVEQEWGFSKYFPSEPNIETSSYDYTLRQHGIYTRANILMGRGWSVTPAIHYVNVNTESIGIENNSRIVQDTSYYNEDLDSTATIYYNHVQLALSPSTLTLNNVVLSLGINKQISVFDLGIFGSWSNLNDLNQVQFGLSATYYPFGNLNFYGNTIVKALMVEEETDVIFSQMIGVKITRFLWIEGFGIFGNLRGTNESNAYIVYNISDEIRLKTGLNLTFVLSSAIQLSFRYQYLQKTGYRWTSGPNMRPEGRIQELDYINQSIIGGLKWTF